MTPNDGTDQRFSSLSLKDLVEARDVYHFHLMNKANVIGTGVGLYLIRDEEKWPHQGGEYQKLTYARTFGNSHVRSYSWPCIMVLVREWVSEHQFGQEGKPSPWDAVPKRLFLSDGRVVPVCVVEARPAPRVDTRLRPPVPRPNETFGGGLPVLVDIQQQTHIATIGALVTDGHITYAITARHACGEPGTELSVLLRSGLARIGVSTAKQITRKLFSDVYPALPLRQTFLNLDVGLVRVDDLNAWTPNTYGLPRIKPLLDVYEQNLSLHRLMDQPVVAVGATSGLLQGAIKALFYRYRSVGGFDYVSDLLIAPADGEEGARQGDSGALWYLQMPDADGKPDQRPLMERDLRPLAIEWGSQVFADRDERTTFSVATSLSNVCKLLDVELVVEGSDSLSGTWGAVGHYTIGSLAIDQVQNATLKAFLQANADRLSIEVDAIKGDLKNSDLLESGFVPLADVPDIVWKDFASPHINRKGQDIGVKGGRDTQSSGHGSTGPEHPNHHCDADRPFANHATLPEACIANPNLITAAKWNEYFDAFPETVDELHRGILPFRVWQIFERMKDAAASHPARFIAAAGILSHYVGDASQPLHGSTMADGIKGEQPDNPRLSERKDEKTKQRLPAFRGEGVHTAYETDMINSAVKKKVLFPEILSHLGSHHGMALVHDGRAAAKATLTLMRDVAQILPPRDIIDVFEASFAPGATHVGALWEGTHTQTGKVMALGVRVLAMLWDAAWAAGGGHTNAGQITKPVLRSLYEDTNFLRSVTVKKIEHEIAHPSPLQPGHP